MLVLGFYSGLSGRVRTVYLFSLCVVSLLSSGFTASAFVWFSSFLKYSKFHFLYFTEHCVQNGSVKNICVDVNLIHLDQVLVQWWFNV
jgi:hypothetical protein